MKNRLFSNVLLVLFLCFALTLPFISVSFEEDVCYETEVTATGDFEIGEVSFRMITNASKSYDCLLRTITEYNENTAVEQRLTIEELKKGLKSNYNLQENSFSITFRSKNKQTSRIIANINMQNTIKLMKDFTVGLDLLKINILRINAITIFDSTRLFRNSLACVFIVLLFFCLNDSTKDKILTLFRIDFCIQYEIMDI